MMTTERAVPRERRSKVCAIFLAMLVLGVWACSGHGTTTATSGMGGTTGTGGTSSSANPDATSTSSAAATVASSSSSSSSTGSGFPINPNAFYVATNGNDGNPGTLALPFATFSHAQMAMRASSVVKTTYVRAGTYSPPTTGNCFGTTGAGNSIELGKADSGETWSFYPPDGFASAILDGKSTMGASGPTGGDGAGCGFNVSGADAIKVVGLHMRNYRYAGFIGYALTNASILDNEVENTRSAVFGGAGIVVEASPHTTIANNYVHDVAYMGIRVSDNSMAGDQMTGASVSGNVVLDSCTWPAVAGGGNDQNGGDCGAIYFWSANPSVSTGMTIENNFVRDVNMASMGKADYSGCCAQGIYLDDGVNSVTTRGNVVTGIVSACFQIHGGRDNAIRDNVCDLEAPASSTIVEYQTDKWSAAGHMSGNVFEDNIVVTGSAGPGQGFAGNGSPPTPMTIMNNAYFDYAGGNVNHGSGGGAGTDSNATNENPDISCWAPSLSSTSPVLSAPVSFPGITGGWGWPGFAIPKAGTAPSWPHGC